MAAPGQQYALPVICNPRDPIASDVDIRFQQVSDPVAAEFTLNTQMFLLSKKELWISDGSMGFGEGADLAFTKGSEIYGRVMVDPVQNLSDSFSCSIEKMFLCTGADGYVPKYSPDNLEYGCLADSPSLLYRFKILDKAQPETQTRAFGNLEFHATLAADHADVSPLVEQPGSDGFSLSSAPLFQVAAGREWYIHAIYTVRLKENAHRHNGKRSPDYHHVLSSAKGSVSTTALKCRRANPDAPLFTQDIGADKNRGTNIQHIAVDHSDKAVIQKDMVPAGTPPGRPALESTSRELGNRVVPITGGLTGLLFLICTVLITLVLLKQRKKPSPGKSNVPVSHSSSSDTATTRHSSSDSSEV